jgi:hypothetical protein
MLSVIMLSVIMLSVIMLSVIMLSIIMLSVIMLSVFRLSVILISVIMLSLAALHKVQSANVHYAQTFKKKSVSCSALFTCASDIVFTPGDIIFAQLAYTLDDVSFYQSDQKIEQKFTQYWSHWFLLTS